MPPMIDDESFDTYRENNRAVSWVVPLIVATALGLGGAAAVTTFAFGGHPHPIPGVIPYDVPMDKAGPIEQRCSTEPVRIVGQLCKRESDGKFLRPEHCCMVASDGGTFTPEKPDLDFPDREPDHEEGDI